MKRVQWPESVVINGESVSPVMVIERLVLSREHVRDKAKVGVALDAWTKLESEPIPDLTDEECEVLTTGLVLRGEIVTPPNFNRYVLRVLRALHFAETVP